jgi:molybdopterin molybdotransferase
MSGGAAAIWQPLTPIRDALALLFGRIQPVTPHTVAAVAAAGRVSAADVASPHDLPRVAVTLRDGWAVDAAEVAGASPHAPLPSRAPAWVEAGEALPSSTDTVLPPEAVQPGAAGPDIIMDAAAGDGVRQPGTDLQAGEVIVPAGSVISAAAVLVLGAAGIDSVDIRVPRLAIIRARDARSASSVTALHAFISAAGRAAGADIAAAVDVGRASAGIAAAILEQGADATIVVGGSGYGREDASAMALSQAGELLARGIALRPGTTACLGLAAGRPVLVVPGRADAGLAAFLALGLPLIRRLAGCSDPPPASRHVLSRKVTSMIGMSDVVFVRRDGEAAEPVGGDEVPLSGIAKADGWLLVPPGCEGYPAATQVGVWPL